jgi:uncharacterized protein
MQHTTICFYTLIFPKAMFRVTAESTVSVCSIFLVSMGMLCRNTGHVQPAASYWRPTVQFALFLLLLLVVAGATDCNAEPRPFRIGTGGLGGVYYPVGKLIAQGITEPTSQQHGSENGTHGIPGIIGVAYNSTGSIANVLAIAANEIEAGLVQADVAFQAMHNQGPFADIVAARDLRAVASLYPEKLQIVTRRDAGIRSVVDFRGKRISIDEIGSGTLPIMRIVLEAHGLTEDDFSPVYLKPIFTTEKMINREIHGFSLMGGAPMEAVSQLNDIALRMVPIAPPTAVQIAAQHPFLVAGCYPGKHVSRYSGNPNPAGARSAHCP